jgi:putative transposase
MWTNENCAKYNRDHLGYPSDPAPSRGQALTDDEWGLVAPFIPSPEPGGGKRRQDMRAVMKGVMYILSTGCQWRYLPKDFPPPSTVHSYFVWWHCDGVLDRIHHALYVECREQAERETSPTACIIDSQSAKRAEKGGLASIRASSMRATDQGQEAAYSRRYAGSIGARRRSFRHSAGIQDRDGGIVLLATLFGQFPFLVKPFADSAYQGPIFGNALAKILPCLETEIVKRSAQAKRFVQLPKRSIAERTIAWLNRCRRLC